MNLIDEYISQFPQAVQDSLQSLRAVILDEIPGATEKISYGMPTFALKKNIVHFAAYTNHIGFYPGASGVEKFQDELTAFKTSKGTIQFPLNQPLPLDLVRKITAFRVKERS